MSTITLRCRSAIRLDVPHLVRIDAETGGGWGEATFCGFNRVREQAILVVVDGNDVPHGFACYRCEAGTLVVMNQTALHKEARWALIGHLKSKAAAGRLLLSWAVC